MVEALTFGTFSAHPLPEGSVHEEHQRRPSIAPTLDQATSTTSTTPETTGCRVTPNQLRPRTVSRLSSMPQIYSKGGRSLSSSSSRSPPSGGSQRCSSPHVGRSACRSLSWSSPRRSCSSNPEPGHRCPLCRSGHRPSGGSPSQRSQARLVFCRRCHRGRNGNPSRWGAHCHIGP